jgi:hypothetical protein
VSRSQVHQRVPILLRERRMLLEPLRAWRGRGRALSLSQRELLRAMVSIGHGATEPSSMPTGTLAGAHLAPAISSASHGPRCAPRDGSGERKRIDCPHVSAQTGSSNEVTRWSGTSGRSCDSTMETPRNAASLVRAAGAGVPCARRVDPPRRPLVDRREGPRVEASAREGRPAHEAHFG